MSNRTSALSVCLKHNNQWKCIFYSMLITQQLRIYTQNCLLLPQNIHVWFTCWLECTLDETELIHNNLQKSLFLGSHDILSCNMNMLENNQQVHDWMSLRSKVQASGWFCMHSTFLQMLLIISYVAPLGECYYIKLLCCDDYFLSLSVVSRAFSALCVYLKFGYHPHPLGYLCAKFRFLRGRHC